MFSVLAKKFKGENSKMVCPSQSCMSGLGLQTLPPPPPPPPPPPQHYSSCSCFSSCSSCSSLSTILLYSHHSFFVLRFCLHPHPIFPPVPFLCLLVVDLLLLILLLLVLFCLVSRSCFTSRGSTAPLWLAAETLLVKQLPAKAPSHRRAEKMEKTGLQIEYKRWNQCHFLLQNDLDWGTEKESQSFWQG